eukprot:s2900_g1.t1
MNSLDVLNVVKQFIGQATGFSSSCSASRRLVTPAELLALQKQRRYEEVCEAWPCLEDFTLQAGSSFGGTPFCGEGKRR